MSLKPKLDLKELIKDCLSTSDDNFNAVRDKWSYTPGLHNLARNSISTFNLFGLPAWIDPDTDDRVKVKLKNGTELWFFKSDDLA